MNMDKYVIRMAQEKDKARILEIYAYARNFMAANGNPNKSAGNLYVIEETGTETLDGIKKCADNENSIVHGVFFFRIGEDPTYKVIERGSWLSDDMYGTIHRVAGDGRIHGVLAMAVQFCEQSINHLRIDTHNDNKIMQHVIEKNGFKRCGIIHVNDGSERIAYEKLV